MELLKTNYNLNNKTSQRQSNWRKISEIQILGAMILRDIRQILGAIRDK